LDSHSWPKGVEFLETLFRQVQIEEVNYLFRTDCHKDIALLENLYVSSETENSSQEDTVFFRKKNEQEKEYHRRNGKYNSLTTMTRAMSPHKAPHG
jgi:hypothetical protein